MGAKQVLVSVLVAIGLGITGMFATQSDRALGATVKFDNTMVVNKNLTDGGEISYFVNDSAKKYQADIRFAAHTWNHALGRRLFKPTSLINKSRLTVTVSGQLSNQFAGMAEINSGVIALNDNWMTRYDRSKRRALIIHELGHTFGTKDLYQYPNLALRRQFRQATIMCGNYSTTIGEFDRRLADWSLAHTRVMGSAEFYRYRVMDNLYFQRMLRGKL